MKYNFTNSTPRENTNSEKYTLREEKFGTRNIEPLWIADMDLDSPIFVQKALQKRLNHCNFGYELFPNSAFNEQIKWLKRHHNTSYSINDVLYSHSVTASINVAIEAFSDITDNIIVQTPVYGPFFTSVKAQNREVLFNELKKDENGYYTFDIKDLKNKINNKTKLLLLCNPANPVGRAWKKEELQELVDICIKNNIIIFSDEVHCDLVYEPYKHTALSTIKGAKNIAISAYGIGKSFNLSGLASSSVFIQNDKIKQTFQKIYNKYHFASGNSLSHVAFEIAYKYGDNWNKDIKEHLYENFLLLEKCLNKYKHLVKLTPLQCTYLAWIDCSAMNMSDKKINNFFIKEAKLGLNRGIFFGSAGKGFVRLNFAVSKEKMKKIISLLNTALANYELN